MEIPWNSCIEGEANNELFCKELLTNSYRLKDGTLNWFDYIKAELQSRGFAQSQIDYYLFRKGSIVLVLHVDSVIIVVKYATDIENLLTFLKEGTNMDTGITKSNLKKFSLQTIE